MAFFSHMCTCFVGFRYFHCISRALVISMKCIPMFRFCHIELKLYSSIRCTKLHLFRGFSLYLTFPSDLVLSMSNGMIVSFQICLELCFFPQFSQFDRFGDSQNAMGMSDLVIFGENSLSPECMGTRYTRDFAASITFVTDFVPPH